jgi:hypothetical protein
MSTQLSRSRNAAFGRQQGLCYYCGLPLIRNPRALSQQLTFKVSERLLRLLECTAEHLTPRCEGGGDHQLNVVAACLFCNQTRHKAKVALPSARYAARVQKRVSTGRWHPKGLAQAARALKTRGFAA